MTSMVLLIARFLMAAIFLSAGVEKITAYAGTQAYMQSMGVPGSLLPLVILLELIGGAMIVLGWGTRLAAWALAAFTLVAALIFHHNFADQTQYILFMLHLVAIGGFMVLAVHGPGAISMDGRRRG
jgi:putative oxidoreductase